MAVQPTPTGTNPASESVKGFKRYDQCRFAIFLGLAHPLIGKAHYQRDDSLGNILRFSLEPETVGKPDIIIAEKEWNGLITTGRSYHCDYCLTLVKTEPTFPQPSADGAGTYQGKKQRRGAEQGKKWWN